ncbi:MAG: glycoside hydrolase family 3 C-terminal domain-containing protein [Lachnospiraceae bacterium]|nr:glycoside hydrolase family 3 C-terminal domain-containing protein [Lachnospiraceae bacterium]
MDKFKDQTLSFAERAADLVSRMTLEEKIAWCGTWTVPIPRLGIPAWHYANEASHGINSFDYVNDKKYNVTSFPVCLAMGQSWDREKIKKVTRAISDEARAAHNIGDESLSFWCPTINLSRDPRNGRSDENFGEDPYLGGRMAAAYIQGLQGADESDKYKKAAATPKHFMLNSSENNRNSGISFADERTIREYYARVFEYAFREGRAESVMISYNRINGVPAGANPFVMGTLLREEWGFDGYVTSDCGAVAQTNNAVSNAVGQKSGVSHYYYNTLEESSAGTLIAGCDISCGGEHRAHLMDAVKQGLITEDQIDKNVIRSITSLFRQGIFDDKGSTPWDNLGAEQLASKEHDELALDMANDSIVLLKNERGLLPIRKQGLRKILVVGPNAKYRELGGYSCGSYGIGAKLDTKYCTLTLDAVCQEVEGDGIEVLYEKGWCSQKEYGGGVLDGLDSLPGVEQEQIQALLQKLFQSVGIQKDENPKVYDLPEFVPYQDPEDSDRKGDNDILFDRALEAAKDADLVIMVAGTDANTASEGSDRSTISLPNGQGEKIERMLEVNPNTVVVLSVIGTIGDPALDKCHSLLCATYGGQQQGKAISNVLFGHVNPNGKLTATWYKDDSQLPHINDYGIRKADVLTQDHGRTYWYFDEEPRFPFGYGIHYTTFDYSNLRLAENEIPNGTSLRVSVDVTNSGEMAGKEIVELYVRKMIDPSSTEKPGYNKPIRQLKGFEKVELQPGETKTVAIEVPLRDITFWNNFRQKMMIEPGEYVVEVGPSSADLPCSESFTIVGEWEAPLSTVYVELDKYCMNSGDTAGMKVVATLEDTRRICLEKYRPVFTSSDETVAHVDDNGVITAKGSGTALVTASVTYGGKTVERSAPVAVR